MRQSIILGLPSSLLLLIAAQAEAQQQGPTAVRKMPIDASEKFIPEYLAFEDSPVAFHQEYSFLSPREAIIAARLQLSVDEERRLATNQSSLLGGRSYRPAYKPHENDNELANGREWGLVRRARHILKVLERRQTCPNGMRSCDNIGAPNKCCMSGEVCVEVDDSNVGGVACCPQGAECGGPVGSCPDGSPTCPTELGGGCCIPGFVCQGVGCVPSSAPTSRPPSLTTVTTTSTTTAEGGEPSTVVVTVIITASREPDTTTSTMTSTLTPSATSSPSAAVPPFRPTSSAVTSSTTESESESRPASDYCPTGFYACLARDGGGCCRTGRDCATSDCPSIPSTTILSNGATIVVPVTDVPDSRPSESCARGWFLCGDDAGPVAGCCPSGYSCGTASCSTVSASHTAEIQKQFPDSDSGNSTSRPCRWEVLLLGVSAAFLGVALL